jgi:hypothetical protein
MVGALTLMSQKGGCARMLHIDRTMEERHMTHTPTPKSEETLLHR